MNNIKHADNGNIYNPHSTKHIISDSNNLHKDNRPITMRTQVTLPVHLHYGP